MKTIKRNWLMKQIELGKMEVKCEMSLTDDYRFDVANEFGVSDWMPARIRHPRFEKRELYNGNVVDMCADDDRKDGFANMGEYEFTGKSGHAYWIDDEKIRLSVHSNLWYTLRVKA
jgi:hypothetical protein